MTVSVISTTKMISQPLSEMHFFKRDVRLWQALKTLAEIGCRNGTVLSCEITDEVFFDIFYAK